MGKHHAANNYLAGGAVYPAIEICGIHHSEKLLPVVRYFDHGDRTVRSTGRLGSPTTGQTVARPTRQSANIVNRDGEGASAKTESTPTRFSDMDVGRYLRDPRRKQAFVTPMFDVIAPRYDRFTRLFSFGMDTRWKARAMDQVVRHCVEGALATPQILDLASGTGDFAIGLAQRLSHVQVTAVDASQGMVREARLRLRALRANASRTADRVDPLVGDMIALPIPSQSMDVVLAGYGVRNVPDAERAIQEMHRVLRIGGLLVLLDFYRPEHAWWRAVFLRYLSVAGNAVGWWWHRDPMVYGYITHSIHHFMSWQQCESLLTVNGFRVTEVTRFLGGGVALHVAVAQPK